ncbi:MAG: DUF2480 family protein [Flavobacteriaceae bacterium]
MSEIVNRVSQSSIITLDLEEYYPEGKRVLFDISPWLFQGIILKEKEFRKHVAEHSWDIYRDNFVAINCSTDAIVPAWAYMLITTRLQPFASAIVVGDLNDLETHLYKEVIDRIDLSSYQNKPVIIKGCSNKPVPLNAYAWATEKIQSVARSVMYGEACSSVPIYKRK